MLNRSGVPGAPWVHWSFAIQMRLAAAIPVVQSDSTCAMYPARYSCVPARRYSLAFQSATRLSFPRYSYRLVTLAQWAALAISLGSTGLCGLASNRIEAGEDSEVKNRYQVLSGGTFRWLTCRNACGDSVFQRHVWVKSVM